MTDITTIIIVAVVVVVLVAIAATALVVARRRRSAALREQFGPEYDRTVRGADDPRDAEKDLAQRRRRHRSLRLRDLDPQERAGYRGRWTQVQQGFVDDPATAVRDADRLVAEVMSARGYPVEDFDQQAEDLSVPYPVLTQRYREARGISREHAAGRAGTEDLRHAVTNYRALVDALLDDTGGDHGRADPAQGDPRAVQAGPQAAHGGDPRAAQGDPRSAPGDPRGMQGDPYAAQPDPRNGQVHPRAAQVDPRAAQGDPRAAQADPRAAQVDPRTGRTDPRGVPVDPRTRPHDPAGPPPQQPPQTGHDTRRETSA
ncbi:hypothetical protein C8E95_6850 [Pseudonocardia autotrophica]|uniref:Secreted protein n=3 Tax=Pseudonocardiaceae TaxID=2070 RepID=A0A1Y2MM94_PSEAH|nr:hypothetical protein BG845_05634 [Pseudonocardia autotrophica]TDN77600.1 hypothetical protein C8E95_6850 [Pseudonocardia autotrophica]BBG01631.1 hypothetical protein Pdca_28400 [Pseudonocardia autotrophica]GEC25376.1 hypothetical protein PSA01_24050 [Pseudonocardia saturnea]